MGKQIEAVDVYELPAHWGPFIMYGDDSNLTEFEVNAATQELDGIYDLGHVLVDVIGEPYFERLPAWKRWSGSDKVIAGMVVEYVAMEHNREAE